MSGRNRLDELKSGKTQCKYPNSYEMGSQSSQRAAPESFSTAIEALRRDICRLEDNTSTIKLLHENTLTAVGQQEINAITARLDKYQQETSDLMVSIRRDLKAISAETARTNGPETKSRQAQQANMTVKMSNAIQLYGQIQRDAKEQYKRRMEREIRIARPDASPQDIERTVADSRHGSAFAEEMLNSRIGAQKRVLDEVKGRHDEMRKLEASIEELANIFMDLQMLLETQGEKINVIETNVEEAHVNINLGGEEIKRAIVTRKSSRKKMCRIITAIVVILIVIVALIFILKR